MSFPNSSVSVPTLAQYQIWFNGCTLGPGTAYEFQKLEGFDRTGVRSNDPDQPRSAGQFIGLDLLGARDMTLSCEIGTDGISLAHAVQTLRNALAPRGVVEDPMFFNISGVTYANTVRIRKDNIPIDQAYTFGSLAMNVSVQFHATDPNIYSTPTLAPVIGLPIPAGGFTFPITFPFTFGSGSGGNSIVCTNYGDVTCYPILTVTGPCSNPSITNATLGKTLTFDFDLNTGDTLVINTGPPHLASFTSAGSTTQTSRLFTLSQASQWWGLVPGYGPNAVNLGANTIVFTSSDVVEVSGTLQVQYASAYSSAT